MKYFALISALALSVASADHRLRSAEEVAIVSDPVIASQVQEQQQTVQPAVQPVQPVPEFVPGIQNAVGVTPDFRSVVPYPLNYGYQQRPQPVHIVPVIMTDDALSRSISANLNGNFLGLGLNANAHALQGNSLAGASFGLNYNGNRGYYSYPYTTTTTQYYTTRPYYTTSRPSYYTTNYGRTLPQDNYVPVVQYRRF